MPLFEGARERIAIWIETRGGQDAIKTFDNIGGAAGRAGQQVEGRFTKFVNFGLQKVGIQSQVTGAALQTGVVAGAAAAATAVAAFVSAGVEQFASLAEKVRDFSRLTGASAEDSSRFVAVLDDLQISAETGGQALFRLGRNATTNAKAFADLGVDIAANADGTVNLTETLLNAADAYAATDDQGQRATLAMTLFGKQGQALVPILEKGRAGLEDFFAGAEDHNQILSQDDLDKAEDYRLALDDLDDAVAGFERAVGEGAVESLADVARGLTVVIDKADQFTQSIGGLGGVFKGFVHVLPGIGPIVQILEELGKESSNAADAQDDLTGAAGETAAALEAEIKQLEDDTKAMHEHVDAVLDAGDAEDKLGTALQHLADAQADDHAADVAAANRDVSDALLSQEQAANRLSDAQDRLNELKNRDIALELRRAQLAERRAQQSAKEAQHTKERAQAELDRLRGDTASTPEQIAKAQEDLEDATLGVDEANQSAADSAKAVVDLQNPQGTKEYRDAVLAVKEAQNGVAKATEAVAEAQRKANEVRAHDNSADITRATREVQRAIEDVAKSGGTIDQQIAAYQRLFTIVPPQFRQFIKDRIFELQALQYQFGQTFDQGAQLGSIFGPITGTTPPPPDPKQPGVGAVIGGIVSGPTAPAPPPAPTGIPDDLNYYGATTPMPRGYASYTDARSYWNLNVTGPTMDDIERYAAEKRRLNALAS